jgi:hypothetical protein
MSSIVNKELSNFYPHAPYDLSYLFHTIHPPFYFLINSINEMCCKIFMKPIFLTLHSGVASMSNVCVVTHSVCSHSKKFMKYLWRYWWCILSHRRLQCYWWMFNNSMWDGKIDVENALSWLSFNFQHAWSMRIKFYTSSSLPLSLFTYRTCLKLIKLFKTNFCMWEKIFNLHQFYLRENSIKFSNIIRKLYR